MTTMRGVLCTLAAFACSIHSVDGQACSADSVPFAVAVNGEGNPVLECGTADCYCLGASPCPEEYPDRAKYCEDDCTQGEAEWVSSIGSSPDSMSLTCCTYDLLQPEEGTFTVPLGGDIDRVQGGLVSTTRGEGSREYAYDVVHYVRSGNGGDSSRRPLWMFYNQGRPERLPTNGEGGGYTVVFKRIYCTPPPPEERNGVSDDLADASYDDIVRAISGSDGGGGGGAGATCFPADALVEVIGGRMKRMDELAIGDRILALGMIENEYTTVIDFLHRMPTTETTFVRLETANETQIELSPGHFLPVWKQCRSRFPTTVTAEAVAVGDCVRHERFLTRIAKKSDLTKIGAYAPLTGNGRLYVNSVLASCYSNAPSEVVSHFFIQMLNNIQKTLVNNLGVVESREELPIYLRAALFAIKAILPMS